MVKEVPLTRGYVALVDDADYELVMQHKWHVERKLRADGTCDLKAKRCIGKYRHEYMHRFLLGGEQLVDHWDGNGLNNQRFNLRPANDSLNAANRTRLSPNKSSRFRGVGWNRAARKWRAKIMVNRRSIHLGFFDDEADAGRAYDTAAVKHFGEFARPNFRDELEAA